MADIDHNSIPKQQLEQKIWWQEIGVGRSWKAE